MRLALRFFAFSIGCWLLRRAGVQVSVAPTAAASAVPPARPDVAQIVNLMTADPGIGLVLQANQPGEPLMAIRFNGPGGRA